MNAIAALYRLWGLARSLLIYYAKPGRARRDLRLYRRFVGPDDLVFDVGAHVGNRTAAFLRLGARCVAVEPQPRCAALLRALYGRNPAFCLVAAALGEQPGTLPLYLSHRTPTVSTTAAAWMERVGRAPSFAGVTWDEQIPAPVTTLDALVERHGLPAFCKIDVEGSELSVLQGLSRPLPALSFEYIPELAADAAACAARLGSLGPYEYNWSMGEQQELMEESWLSPEDLIVRLRRLPAGAPSGDVYARLK